MHCHIWLKWDFQHNKTLLNKSYMHFTQSEKRNITLMKQRLSIFTFNTYWWVFACSGANCFLLIRTFENSYKFTQTLKQFAQKESVQTVLGKLSPLLQLSIWLKCVIIKQHDICVSRFNLQSQKKKLCFWGGIIYLSNHNFKIVTNSV